MTEQRIELEEVRVGDRIRIEFMMADISKTWTGTVARIGMDGDLLTQEEWFIGPAYIQDHINKGARINIVLLDRPKPKLPTEVGSVIHVSECQGEKCDVLAMLCDDGLWYTPIPVPRVSFHSPSNITEWEPRNVVEVQE